ncbi:MAG: AarF/UbiB family protein, partial [Actinobacteria bacterium]|nr:AarF/UbiB family protein [Actinomycetota bacterium]
MPLDEARHHGTFEGDDAKIGSFSSAQPWVVEPERLEWLPATEQLRVRTRAQVPVLLRHRRIPPARRVLGTGLSLGAALLGWRLIDRRRGKVASRRGLSRRLRRSFEQLGPTYIKLGQIISSGEGIFPAELVDEFRLLRDSVPAEDFSVVQRTIEDDLGGPIENFFATFDRKPVAAASIAQVYFATLLTGEPVAVKVQRSRVSDLV